ncbi:MAG: phosphoribosyltransferase family protein, partial [Elusimicrobiota bacterium]|nr:phosphoribosyltransferase family protein [Elusimicrobiota bacterium]
MPALWRDRVEAGEALGARLRAALRGPCVVLGLTRGGVPVARAAAAALGAPLDALVVRKVGAPGNPECAVGAVGEDGAAWRDDALLRRLGLDEAWFERAARPERAEVRRRSAFVRA